MDIVTSIQSLASDIATRIMQDPTSFMDQMDDTIENIYVDHPYIGKNFGYPIDARYRWFCLADRKGYVGYYGSNIKVLRFFEGEISDTSGEFEDNEIIEIVTDLSDSSVFLVLTREKKRPLYRLYFCIISIDENEELDLDIEDLNFFEPTLPSIQAYNWNIVVSPHGSKPYNASNVVGRYYDDLAVVMGKGHFVKYKGKQVFVDGREYTLAGEDRIHVSPGVVGFQTDTKLIYVTPDQIYELDALPNEKLCGVFRSIQYKTESPDWNHFCISVDGGNLVRTPIDFEHSDTYQSTCFIEMKNEKNVLFCKRTLFDKPFPISREDDSPMCIEYPEFLQPCGYLDNSYPCYTHDGRKFYLRNRLGDYIQVDLHGVYKKSDQECYIVNPMLSQRLTLKELLSLRTRLSEL